MTKPGELTDAELVAEIERLERLLNRQRRAGGGSPPTLFEVQRRLDAFDQEWRLRQRNEVLLHAIITAFER